MTTAQKTVRLFWHHAKRYPAHLWGLTILVPVSILLQQFLPQLLVANVLERLGKGDFNPGQLLDSFGTSMLLYALLVFLTGVVLWRCIIIMIWKLEMQVTRDIDNRVFGHLLTMSAHFHANRFGGSLVSQANRLSGAYIRFADTTFFEIATFITSFVLTVVILLPRVPWFVLLLVLISGGYMTAAYFITRKTRQFNEAETKAATQQTGFLADSVTNVMAVKSFSAENYERTRYAKATAFTRAATARLMRTATKRDLFSSTVISTIDVVALIAATASVVLFNAEIATVFLVLNYTNNISRRLWDFNSHVLRQYNKALGDSAEMVEILDLQPDVKDPAKPQKSLITNGAIDFADITFTHTDADDALFKNLHLSVKSGEKIGLVGHSGSGKTTLTKLLLRFADVEEGAVVIDGQNIATITQADLRRSIAYVPQEPLLFHRTISENIAYGKPKATKKQIIEAAKAANADEFIRTLPKGYNTLVGERGVKLSGGQRQRIAIARAMIKDAPILVLDEATSALDSESEKLIQTALWRLMKNRTAIVIAHRLSTVQRMDRIIVLENGKIVEQGSHKELLAQKGVYASLWAHQSGGFIEE